MLDKILTRLGLVRQSNMIEALIHLRQQMPKMGEKGYISDRQWREVANIAAGRGKA